MQGLTTGCGVGLMLMAMMLGGCSDLKKNLGLEREMPDEYNVSPYQKTLEIPPSYDLKPPKQGDASAVVPFKDNPHSKAPRGKLSPAEQALMRDVGPGISPQDQMALDGEAVAEQDQADQKRGPLEGKFLSKKRKVGAVIDPLKEPSRGPVAGGGVDEEILPEAIPSAVNH